MKTENAAFVSEIASGYCPKLESNHQITVTYSWQSPPEVIWKWKPFECDYKNYCSHSNHCPIFENAVSSKLKYSN